MQNPENRAPTRLSPAARMERIRVWGSPTIAWDIPSEEGKRGGDRNRGGGRAFTSSSPSLPFFRLGPPVLRNSNSRTSVYICNKSKNTYPLVQKINISLEVILNLTTFINICISKNSTMKIYLKINLMMMLITYYKYYFYISFVKCQVTKQN